MGMPVDLYLGWVLFWEALPALAFRRVHLALVVAVMVWLDLLAMPQATPVVRLGTNWLLGEATGVALCLVAVTAIGSMDGRRSEPPRPGVPARW